MSYYDDNAKEYIEKTINCDMQAQYDMLLKYIKKGTLLDVGFGSARDMLYFKRKGFEVYGIDPTEEFCNHARKLGFEVELSTIEEYKTDRQFDVIWACASLLHCKDLKEAIGNCYYLLKTNGLMYISLKLGHDEEFVNGRYFYYVTEEQLYSIAEEAGLSTTEISISEAQLLNKETKWINAILKKCG